MSHPASRRQLGPGCAVFHAEPRHTPLLVEHPRESLRDLATHTHRSVSGSGSGQRPEGSPGLSALPQCPSLFLFLLPDFPPRPDRRPTPTVLHGPPGHSPWAPGAPGSQPPWRLQAAETSSKGKVWMKRLQHQHHVLLPHTHARRRSEKRPSSVST